MGLKDFFPDMLPGFKINNQKPLSVYGGSRIGVDLSIWLHIAVQSTEVALCLHMFPTYVPNEVLSEIQRRHHVLVDSGFTPHYVFDGKRHPIKRIARQAREGSFLEAWNRLEAFMTKGKSTNSPISDKERKDAVKDMLLHTKPGEEIISLVKNWMMAECISYECAPFEADWQLIALEQQGIIDGIMTNDSDLIALGGSNLYFDAKFASSGKESTCVHFNRSDVLASNTYVLFNRFEKHLPEVAAFLGCDYIKRLPGSGPATVLKGVGTRRGLLESYLAAEDRQAFLDGMGRKHNLPSYSLDFNRACHLFRHAPYYNCRLNMLLPLAEIDDGAGSWPSIIGFDPNELLFPLTQENYSCASKFDCCSFQSGVELKTFLPPVYKGTLSDNPGVTQGTLLPRFAVLDFDKFPIRCTPSEVLECWAASRGVVFRKDDSRDQLEENVQIMVANGTFILEPQHCVKDMKWLGFEALEVQSEESGWSSQYYTKLQSLTPITDKDVDCFYPDGDEQNRFRGKALANGGNIIVGSIQSIAVKAASGGKPMVLFRCLCIPSQKSDKIISANVDTRPNKEHYTLYLCFEECGRVQGFPYSCCGCPKGRTFCSHLIGFLIVCALAQQEMGGQADFEANVPPSPYAVQQHAILVENLCRKDPFNRSKVSKLAKSKRRESLGIASPIKKLRRSPT
jgi:5'-3' exonuclease